MNKDPVQFLSNNRFYDSKVVGAFCEKLDPYLSYLAYRRAWGNCDEELIDVTNRNTLFKDQARYLVERMDMDLWMTVLTDDNEFMGQLVEVLRNLLNHVPFSFTQNTRTVILLSLVIGGGGHRIAREQES